MRFKHPDHQGLLDGSRRQMLERGDFFLGKGRNRATFTYSAGLVCKVAVNEQGMCDNEFEARTSSKFGDLPDINGIRYARCELLECGCLTMEYVSAILDQEELDLVPWAKYIDTAQIGRTADGRIVAYDFGYDS